MKRKIITSLFIILYSLANAQNLDLVVTNKGDSIACKIDSVSNNVVYYQMKSPHNSKWVQTMYDKENIAEIKYDCINRDEYVFEKGSTIIVGTLKNNYPKKYPGKQYLTNASPDELNFYMARAKKVKKTGGVITLAGGSLFAAGLVLIATNTEASGYTGMWMGLLGTGTTLIGLPVLITGKTRMNSIEKIKKSKGITFELLPNGNFDFHAKKYQPGLTFKVRF